MLPEWDCGSLFTPRWLKTDCHRTAGSCVPWHGKTTGPLLKNVELLQSYYILYRHVAVPRRFFFPVNRNQKLRRLMFNLCVFFDFKIFKRQCRQVLKLLGAVWICSTFVWFKVGNAISNQMHENPGQKWSRFRSRWIRWDWDFCGPGWATNKGWTMEPSRGWSKNNQDRIICAGDVGTELYFVAVGEVEVVACFLETWEFCGDDELWLW